MTDRQDLPHTGVRAGSPHHGESATEASPPTGSPATGARDAVAQALRPRLRGWLHAGIFPLSVVGGVVLVVLAGDPWTRLACAVYSLTAALLFGVSAVYHRGRWSPRAARVLRRFDHANIFLIIAGTYTPFTLVLLDGSARRLLLVTIWTGALLGVAFRVFWVGAPRWLYTPIYVALGWTAVFFLPDFLRAGGAAVVALIVVGGLLYSLGGLVYGVKRPDPSPRWFGFHEVFHSLTLGGYLAHYVAVSIAVYAVAGRG